MAQPEAPAAPAPPRELIFTDMMQRIYSYIGQVSYIVLRTEKGSSMNVVHAMRVSSQVHQGWELLKQTLNNSAPAIAKYKETMHRLDPDGPEISTMHICNTFRLLAPHYQIALTKGSIHIGPISSVIALFEGFRCRLEELRCGHTQYPNGANEKGTIYSPISDWGLSAAHGPLLEGIRWPADVRSSLAGAMGPLTQAIQLKIASEKVDTMSRDLSKRWADALKSSILHLPNHMDIIGALKKSDRASTRQILGLLGNLLLATGGRQNQKVTLPMNVLWMNCTSETAGTVEDFTTGRALVNPGMTLSGKKSINLYNQLTTMSAAGTSPMEIGEPSQKKRQKLASTLKFYHFGEHTGEIFLHCCFGTFNENLNLLAKITGRPKWSTRRELDCFNNLATKEHKIFEPIRFQYYSKPSSANQSHFFRAGSQAVSSLPVFSGTHSSYHPALFSYLEKAFHVNTAITGTNVATVIAELREYVSDIRARGEASQNLLKRGTGKWWTLQGSIFVECDEPNGIQGLADKVFMGIVDEVVSRKTK